MSDKVKTSVKCCVEIEGFYGESSYSLRIDIGSYLFPIVMNEITRWNTP